MMLTAAPPLVASRDAFPTAHAALLAAARAAANAALALSPASRQEALSAAAGTGVAAFQRTALKAFLDTLPPGMLHALACGLLGQMRAPWAQFVRAVLTGQPLPVASGSVSASSLGAPLGVGVDLAPYLVAYLALSAAQGGSALTSGSSTSASALVRQPMPMALPMSILKPTMTHGLGSGRGPGHGPGFSYGSGGGSAGSSNGSGAGAAPLVIGSLLRTSDEPFVRALLQLPLPAVFGPAALSSLLSAAARIGMRTLTAAPGAGFGYGAGAVAAASSSSASHHHDGMSISAALRELAGTASRGRIEEPSGAPRGLLPVVPRPTFDDFFGSASAASAGSAAGSGSSSGFGGFAGAVRSVHGVAGRPAKPVWPSSWVQYHATQASLLLEEARALLASEAMEAAKQSIRGLAQGHSGGGGGGGGGRDRSSRLADAGSAAASVAGAGNTDQPVAATASDRCYLAGLGHLSALDVHMQLALGSGGRGGGVPRGLPAVNEEIARMQQVAYAHAARSGAAGGGGRYGYGGPPPPQPLPVPGAAYGSFTLTIDLPTRPAFVHEVAASGGGHGHWHGHGHGHGPGPVRGSQVQARDVLLLHVLLPEDASSRPGYSGYGYGHRAIEGGSSSGSAGGAGGGGAGGASRPLRTVSVLGMVVRAGTPAPQQMPPQRRGAGTGPGGAALTTAPAPKPPKPAALQVRVRVHVDVPTAAALVSALVSSPARSYAAGGSPDAAAPPGMASEGVGGQVLMVSLGSVSTCTQAYQSVAAVAYTPFAALALCPHLAVRNPVLDAWAAWASRTAAVAAPVATSSTTSGSSLPAPASKLLEDVKCAPLPVGTAASEVTAPPSSAQMTVPAASMSVTPAPHAGAAAATEGSRLDEDVVADADNDDAADEPTFSSVDGDAPASARMQRDGGSPPRASDSAASAGQAAKAATQDHSLPATGSNAADAALLVAAPPPRPQTMPPSLYAALCARFDPSQLAAIFATVCGGQYRLPPLAVSASDGRMAITAPWPPMPPQLLLSPRKLSRSSSGGSVGEGSDRLSGMPALLRQRRSGEIVTLPPVDAGGAAAEVTLIIGPPGTGKTRTILGCLSALRACLGRASNDFAPEDAAGEAEGGGVASPVGAAPVRRTGSGSSSGTRRSVERKRIGDTNGDQGSSSSDSCESTDSDSDSDSDSQSSDVASGLLLTGRKRPREDDGAQHSAASTTMPAMGAVEAALAAAAAAGPIQAALAAARLAQQHRQAADSSTALASARMPDAVLSAAEQHHSSDDASFDADIDGERLPLDDDSAAGAAGAGRDADEEDDDDDVDGVALSEIDALFAADEDNAAALDNVTAGAEAEPPESGLAMDLPAGEVDDSRHDRNGGVDELFAADSSSTGGASSDDAGNDAAAGEGIGAPSHAGAGFATEAASSAAAAVSAPQPSPASHPAPQVAPQAAAHLGFWEDEDGALIIDDDEDEDEEVGKGGNADADDESAVVIDDDDDDDNALGLDSGSGSGSGVPMDDIFGVDDDGNEAGADAAAIVTPAGPLAELHGTGAVKSAGLASHEAAHPAAAAAAPVSRMRSRSSDSHASGHDSDGSDDNDDAGLFLPEDRPAAKALPSKPRFGAGAAATAAAARIRAAAAARAALSPVGPATGPKVISLAAATQAARGLRGRKVVGNALSTHASGVPVSAAAAAGGTLAAAAADARRRALEAQQAKQQALIHKLQAAPAGNSAANGTASAPGATHSSSSAAAQPPASKRPRTSSVDAGARSIAAADADRTKARAAASASASAHASKAAPASAAALVAHTYASSMGANGAAASAVSASALFAPQAAAAAAAKISSKDLPLRHVRVLVCAPSNAAVDEIVSRLLDAPLPSEAKDGEAAVDDSASSVGKAAASAAAAAATGATAGAASTSTSKPSSSSSAASSTGLLNERGRPYIPNVVRLGAGAAVSSRSGVANRSLEALVTARLHALVAAQARGAGAMAAYLRQTATAGPGPGAVMSLAALGSGPVAGAAALHVVDFATVAALCSPAEIAAAEGIALRRGGDRTARTLRGLIADLRACRSDAEGRAAEGARLEAVAAAVEQHASALVGLESNAAARHVVQCMEAALRAAGVDLGFSRLLGEAASGSTSSSGSSHHGGSSAKGGASLLLAPPPLPAIVSLEAAGPATAAVAAALARSSAGKAAVALQAPATPAAPELTAAAVREAAAAHITSLRERAAGERDAARLSLRAALLASNELLYLCATETGAVSSARVGELRASASHQVLREAEVIVTTLAGAASIGMLREQREQRPPGGAGGPGAGAGAGAGAGTSAASSASSSAAAALSSTAGAGGAGAGGAGGGSGGGMVDFGDTASVMAGVTFDAIVIDEAGQAVEAEALVPLRLAYNGHIYATALGLPPAGMSAAAAAAAAAARGGLVTGYGTASPGVHPSAVANLVSRGGSMTRSGLVACDSAAVALAAGAPGAAAAAGSGVLLPSPLVGLVCRRLILVGDPLQLPATVLSRTASAAGLEVSLFERLAGAGLTPLLLRTQYRMPGAISAFSSRHFYRGLVRDAAHLHQGSGSAGDDSSSSRSAAAGSASPTEVSASLRISLEALPADGSVVPMRCHACEGALLLVDVPYGQETQRGASGLTAAGAGAGSGSADIAEPSFGNDAEVAAVASLVLHLLLTRNFDSLLPSPAADAAVAGASMHGASKSGSGSRAGGPDERKKGAEPVSGGSSSERGPPSAVPAQIAVISGYKEQVRRLRSRIREVLGIFFRAVAEGKLDEGHGHGAVAAAAAAAARGLMRSGGASADAEARLRAALRGEPIAGVSAVDRLTRRAIGLVVVSSVDSFQGQELPTVIISCVRSRPLALAADGLTPSAEAIRRVLKVQVKDTHSAVKGAGADADSGGTAASETAGGSAGAGAEAGAGVKSSAFDLVSWRPSSGDATSHSRPGSIGFLADPRRLNVAVTRAKQSLVVVGNLHWLAACDDNWRALISHIASHGDQLHINPANAKAEAGSAVWRLAQATCRGRPADVTSSAAAAGGRSVCACAGLAAATAFVQGK